MKTFSIVFPGFVVFPYQDDPELRTLRTFYSERHFFHHLQPNETNVNISLQRDYTVYSADRILLGQVIQHLPVRYNFESSSSRNVVIMENVCVT